MKNEEKQYKVTELFNNGVYRLTKSDSVYPDYTLTDYRAETLVGRQSEGAFGEMARFVPSIYIDGDVLGNRFDGKFKVEIQTTSYGALSTSEFDLFMKAQNTAWTTAAIIESTIEAVLEGKEIKGAVVIYDSEAEKVGE